MPSVTIQYENQITSFASQRLWIYYVLWYHLQGRGEEGKRMFDLLLALSKALPTAVMIFLSIIH